MCACGSFIRICCLTNLLWNDLLWHVADEAASVALRMALYKYNYDYDYYYYYMQTICSLTAVLMYDTTLFKVCVCCLRQELNTGTVVDDIQPTPKDTTCRSGKRRRVLQLGQEN